MKVTIDFNNLRNPTNALPGMCIFSVATPNFGEDSGSSGIENLSDIVFFAAKDKADLKLAIQNEAGELDEEDLKMFEEEYKKYCIVLVGTIQ